MLTDFIKLQINHAVKERIKRFGIKNTEIFYNNIEKNDFQSDFIIEMNRYAQRVIDRFLF
jgi:protein-tyrosine-phosphatase